MELKILYIISLVLLASCTRDENNKTDNSNNPTTNPPVDTTKYYYWAGTVDDQVTVQPVNGAYIYWGLNLDCEKETLTSIDPAFTATSGSDGKFVIKVLKSYYSGRNWCSAPGCTYLEAIKSGFAGSTRIPFSCQTPKNFEVGKISMIHFATLNLHVKRDTLKDKYETIEIWLTRFSSLTYWYDYKIICQGKYFDSVFTYNSLWSNTTYTIKTGSVGRSQIGGTTYYTCQTVLRPDTINTYSISFTHGMK